MSMIESPRFPLVLCIDVEPDEQQVPLSERRPWSGFEIALEWVKPVRERLANLTGNRPNFGWFLRLDYQIEVAYGSRRWVADNHAADLEALLREGDELGIHPHAWRLDGAGGWRVDLASQDWVAHVTAESVETYAQVYGQLPRAHRFGDGFMSDPLIAQLRLLGLKVDVTAEPGMTLTTSGVRAPRFRGKEPYRAGDSRLARRADQEFDAPVLLPLASVDPDPALPLWRRAARRIRYPNRPRHRQMILGLEMPASRFWDLLARDLDARQLNVLSFAIRSSSFTSDTATRLITAKLDTLVDHPLGRRIDFVTPSRAAELVLRS